MVKARDWCFAMPMDSPLKASVVTGKEIAYSIYRIAKDQSGDVYYQGLIQFQSRVSRSLVQSLLSTDRIGLLSGPVSMALSQLRSTEDVVEGPFEYGTSLPDEVYVRDSLPTIINAIRNSAGLPTRNIDGALSSKELSIELYLGPPESISTLKAIQDNVGAYVKSSTGFNGYLGQSVIVMDGEHSLLDILLRFPWFSNSKGRNRQLRVSKIVVASHRYPWHWYTEPIMEAILPLVSKVIYFDGTKEEDSFSFLEFNTVGKDLAYYQLEAVCRNYDE